MIMRFATSLSRRVVSAGATALTSAAILTGAAFAQDASPVATPGGPSEGFPVAIHQGTCADYAESVAFELENAVTFGVQGGTQPETIGASGVNAVVYATSGTLDAPLEQLATDGHVILVHESPQNPDVVIACAPLSGPVDDGRLAIAITPLEDATVVGLAILEGEDQVDAEIFLFDTSVADTPEATPAAEATPAS
jgi:hypothetical protein